MRSHPSISHLSPPRDPGDLGAAGAALGAAGGDLGDPRRGAADAASGSGAHRVTPEAQEPRRLRKRAWRQDKASAEARAAMVAEVAIILSERVTPTRGQQPVEYWTSELATLTLDPWEVETWKLPQLAQYLTDAKRRMPRAWRAEILRIEKLRHERQRRKRNSDQYYGRTAKVYRDHLMWTVRHKRERTTWQLAKHYHANVAALFTSKRGSLQWGKGPHEQTSWNVYSRSYHRKNGPTVWHNAGLDYVIEDHRIVVRLWPVHGSPAGNSVIRLDYEAWRLHQRVERIDESTTGEAPCET